MLFDSIDFAVFCTAVFLIYWSLGSKRFHLQNAVLLIASYIFYGWWDWRFLTLIVISSAIDYLVGLALVHAPDKSAKKGMLVLSLTANLGMLGFFKYFNFFVDSFAAAFSLFGYSFDLPSLNIILPVGISFYTFQTLSYTIDVYRGKIRPTKNALAFFSYVSFFPQLVAGPIERAANLLPQFERSRHFDSDLAFDGLRQMLWGLFKKVVIADNCATVVNQIYGNHEAYTGVTLLFGALMFAFQIYGDFSGYSDIAIGTSRLFGFHLMKNFAFPIYARDIPEFWRRWHISLTTWFRDYVYLSLSGGKIVRNRQKMIRYFIITFTISGLWHGANWTFVTWGFLNALYFLPWLTGMTKKRFTGDIAAGRIFPTWDEGIRIVGTFTLLAVTLVFFRAESIHHAIGYLQTMVTAPWGWLPDLMQPRLMGLMGIFLSIDWLHRNKEYGLQLSPAIPEPVRWGIYFAIVMMILEFGGEAREFIYFQF